MSHHGRKPLCKCEREEGWGWNSAGVGLTALENKKNRYYATRAKWQQWVCLGAISALLESRGCWKTKISEPVGLKLKRWGSSRPLGSRVFGWRNSSKKAWEQASNGENREAGVYSSRREHRVMASGGVRGLNTWNKTNKYTCSTQNHANGYWEWHWPSFINRFYARICFYQSGRVRSRRSNLTSGLSVCTQARVSGFLLQLLKVSKNNG